MIDLIDRSEVLYKFAEVLPEADSLDWYKQAKPEEVKDLVDEMYSIVLNVNRIDAQPVKPMNGKAHWTNTDETVWEARDKDSGEEFEISIVTAKCSFCGRWAEQVNAFPPYMHYEYCPHCGRKMN